MTRPRSILFTVVAASVVAASVVACEGATWPSPPPITAETHLAEVSEWRQGRRDGLVRPPSGPLLWIGLWELAQGETRFGSDPDLPIVLPAVDAPAFAGTIYREGQEVRVEPAPGVDLRLRDTSGDEVDRSVRGERVTGPIPFANDRSDVPTELTLGSLGMRVHMERGSDRLWLRAWDEDSPSIGTFELPPTFPLDLDWRVMARYEPYGEPRIMPVSDIIDGTVDFEAPGELVFRHDDREYRLIAMAGESSRNFFVMMWDETGRSMTYEGMRYMRVDFPDVEGWDRNKPGWTIIDFNRAYNPPCVFTPYSVCALPPRENYLPIEVRAGELKPAGH